MRLSNICVTIATQRSGTKLLGNCFNAGTEILALGELFHDQSTSPLSFKRFVSAYSGFAEMYSMGRLFDVLDSYFDELRGLYKNVQFDLMYSNLYFGGPLWWDDPSKLPILEYFISRQFAVIHLIRNVTDTYVSLVNAQLTGSYHETADGITSTPVEYPEFSPEYGDILSKYEAYARNTLKYRGAVAEYLKEYPYACAIDFEDMLSKQGVLTNDVKTRIAAAIQNISRPGDIQINPVNLLVSRKLPIAKKLAEAIR